MRWLLKWARPGRRYALLRRRVDVARGACAPFCVDELALLGAERPLDDRDEPGFGKERLEDHILSGLTVPWTTFSPRPHAALITAAPGKPVSVSIENITPADVRWICQRLDRLTDRQWQEAFRAAGYEREVADRFIRKVKQKVAEGLALKG